MMKHFLQNMDVASQDSVSQETTSQEYEIIYEEDNLDIEKDGLLEATPMGIAENYTTTEDKSIFAAWKKVGLVLAVGTEQTKNTY
jgi:hypothetical protein